MKIAILKAKEKSAWQSCQTISKNLMAAYALVAEQKGAQIEVVQYTRKEMETSARRIFESMQRRGVQRIVLVDHFPYPGNLFSLFAQAFTDLDYFPEIYVHTYGCLMLWFHELDHKSEFFSKCKIHLITASGAQRDLIAQFLQRRVRISVINFPINTEVFKPLKNRSAIRRTLGFTDDDILLIYTGRAHVQKNLPLLLKSVAPLMKTNPAIKFLFAGRYDDGPVNFLEYRFAYGSSKEMISTVIKEAGIEKQFISLGSLPHGQLVRYLNAADAFCSLSMYNDEDYGYAPLEALSSGCPALVTAWGGYKEFESPHTQFVKVTREYVNKLDSLFLSPTEVRSKLQEILENPPSDRAAAAHDIHERFSIAAVADQIWSMHKDSEPTPLSFNPKVFAKFKKVRAYPLHRYSYLDIYQSYYR